MNNTISKSEINVAEIMNGEKNVVLLHDEKRYALTITRRGKLILTAAEDSITEKISINRSIQS